MKNSFKILIIIALLSPILAAIMKINKIKMLSDILMYISLLSAILVLFQFIKNYKIVKK